MRRVLLFLFAASFSACFCGFAGAADLQPFALRYGVMQNGVGDNPLRGFVAPQDEDSEMTSTRNFTAGETAQIEVGVRYWAERMAGIARSGSALIYAGFAADKFGSAFSASPQFYRPYDDSSWGVSPNGTVYDFFISGRPSPWPAGLADNIIIFQYPYSASSTRLLLNDASIVSTMLHEMGHALGIMGISELTNAVGGFSLTGVFDAGMFTEWNAHLYDVFGKQAKPGMGIALDAQNGYRPGVFQIYGDDLADAAAYVYPRFHGTQVDALTGGKGMPVMGAYPGYQGSVLDGANSLGHPGLMQSIMSYGIIRNMPFTEMELAMFQDLGYPVDRREFFGKSYYCDVGGDSQINRLGFGTAKAPNAAAFGLGLHIMRDKLSLTQAADIHAGGYGGGGARIDGTGNSLLIPRGVTVAADGSQGTGLLVSYGSNNRVTLGGVLSASGPGGIGAHFGILAANEGIHSYMGLPLDLAARPIQEQHEYLAARDGLSGPLVSEFDVRGSLRGTQAAIRIEHDAHVAAINFYDGAAVTGNIISAWARDPAVLNRGTAITFGRPGSGGNMALTGDIAWQRNDSILSSPENSLDVTQQGGRLLFNGAADVARWDIAAGATLSGNSAIRIAGRGQALTNAGTIAPGSGSGAIAVRGDYVQKPTGLLSLSFTPASSDSFLVTGSSSIAGKLALTPQPGYYADGSRQLLSDAALFGSTLSVRDFTALELSPPASPTLRGALSLAGGSDPGAAVVWNRPADAYSRHATGRTTADLGETLFALSSGARGDMQNLFTALDFSGPDGRTLRSALKQLSPTAYDNTMQSSLDAGRVLASAVLSGMQTGFMPSSAGPGGRDDASGGYADRNATAGPRIFALPYGSGVNQRGKGDQTGYDASTVGLVSGANWDFARGAAGFHVSYAHRQTNSDTRSTSRSYADALGVGAQGAVRFDPGFFTYGLANVGIENTSLRRPVSVNGYERENNADFTAWTGLAVMRAGREWQAGDWRFGPLAGLDYGAYFRPAVSESGGKATRLRLQSGDFHSLRSAVGARAQLKTGTSNGPGVQADLSAEWKHELLDVSRGSRASFAGYDEEEFQVKNRRDGRDAMALQGALSLSTDNGLTFGAFAGTEFFRPGYRALAGGLSISWDF